MRKYAFPLNNYWGNLNILFPVGSNQFTGTSPTGQAAILDLAGNGNVAGTSSVAIGQSSAGVSTILARGAQQLQIGSGSGNQINISSAGAITITDTTGTLWGAPAGGAQGSGTINAVGLFVGGVAVLTSVGSINANSLTGTTLAAGVVNSSLTSVGTLGSVTITNAVSGGSFITTGQTNEGAGTINGGTLFQSGNPVMSIGTANSGVGTVVVKTKAAATNRNTTATPANDPDLTYTIPANGTYIIQMYIPYSQNGATTNGIAMNVNYSGTITAGSQAWFLNTTAVNGAGQPIAAAVGTVVGQNTASPAGTTWQATCQATLVCASGGVVAFSWSQQNSSATNTSVLQGASMIITRIA